MSGAGTTQAFQPSKELLTLMEVDRWSQHNLSNWEKLVTNRRAEVKETRNEIKELRNMNSLIPAIKTHLRGTTEVDSMKRMTAALDAVNAAGGIENLTEMKKAVEDFEKKQADKKATIEAIEAKTKVTTKRADVNKAYTETLGRKGLQKGAIYIIQWKGLTDFITGATLNTAYSFGIVLGGCELPEKDPSADPSKIHIRLTFHTHLEVNELYMNWSDDEDFMVMINKSNAFAMCSKVFDDTNVGILRAADCGDLIHQSDYKKKLMNDSLLEIKSMVKDSYSALLDFWSGGSKRVRNDVNYKEKPMSKRRSSQGSSSNSLDIEVQPYVEELDSDDEDVVVSSLA